MPRTAGGLRSDTPTRLNELQRDRPEWRAWIRLLTIAEEASHDTSWSAPVTSRDATTRSSDSPENVPLLHGRSLQVIPSRVQRLIRDLASAASEGDIEGGTSLRHFRPSEAEALKLFSAAVREDGDGIQVMGAGSNIDAGALATVAHLAAYPVLQSCGRQLESQVPSAWQLGYCPVCAAWPTLAERRGLDRSRRLRCGRCATQWEVPWLYCIYCGERNHERLGSLEAEGQGELLKVETCTTCQGYLKSLATLQGFPAFELLLQDLETVEFDLVALDRGYTRPRHRGFTLELQIVDRASGRAL
jgi:FdhE protein